MTAEQLQELEALEALVLDLEALLAAGRVLEAQERAAAVRVGLQLIKHGMARSPLN